MALWTEFADATPRIAEVFVVGAASVAVADGHLAVTTWREGGAETVTRKL